MVFWQHLDSSFSAAAAGKIEEAGVWSRPEEFILNHHLIKGSIALGVSGTLVYVEVQGENQWESDPGLP
jgi:hypothetical protein